MVFDRPDYCFDSEHLTGMYVGYMGLWLMIVVCVWNIHGQASDDNQDKLS